MDIYIYNSKIYIEREDVSNTGRRTRRDGGKGGKDMEKAGGEGGDKGREGIKKEEGETEGIKERNIVW